MHVLNSCILLQVLNSCVLLYFKFYLVYLVFYCIHVFYCNFDVNLASQVYLPIIVTARHDFNSVDWDVNP